VELEWRPEKYAGNLIDHGIPFERAYAFDWAGAMCLPTRPGTDAVRDKYLGHIDGRLYAAIVTPRGDRLHLISLRPASRRERRRYAQATI
jgi:uncharacterized DUF497 family protein